MKRIKNLLFLLLVLCPPWSILRAEHNPQSDDFKIILEPQWQTLDPHITTSLLHIQEKWVIAGTITFKKRSKEPVALTHLDLYWKGAFIHNLFGSLYRLPHEKDFLPVEEHLVCDGTWNRAKQLLKLSFSKKQSLGPTNSFCLVLTMPEAMEPILKHGSFSISNNSIPEQFRDTINKNNLSLCLDALDTHINTQPQHENHAKASCHHAHH